MVAFLLGTNLFAKPKLPSGAVPLGIWKAAPRVMERIEILLNVIVSLTRHVLKVFSEPPLPYDSVS